MQRQSLGSPVSKLHGHGGGGSGPKDDVDDSKHKDLPSPSLARCNFDDEDDKTAKSRRFSMPSLPSLSPTPASSKPERFIHLIPVLTLLCFLVLYLVSHSPSQSDLAHFNGLKRSSKRIDSNEMDNIGQLADPRRGDALAMRSLTTLGETTDKRTAPKSRYHRKIADF